MQGELADTGAHILSQADIGRSNGPLAPTLGAERAFNQALNAAGSSEPVNVVNEVDVSSPINDFSFPRVGEISEVSQNHLSMKDLDHSDWGAKQLVDSVKLGSDSNASLMDNSMGYMEGLESERRDSIKNVLDVEKHMKPLHDLIEAHTEKRNSEANISHSDMTREERMFEIERSMQARAMENAELQTVSIQVQGDMSAATRRANFSMAAFTMAKEISTGFVSMVKNIINNTR